MLQANEAKAGPQLHAPALNQAFKQHQVLPKHLVAVISTKVSATEEKRHHSLCQRPHETGRHSPSAVEQGHAGRRLSGVLVAVVECVILSE
jgi:hypothetical protein